MRATDFSKLEHMVIALTCPRCGTMFGLKMAMSVGYQEVWKCKCGHTERTRVRDNKEQEDE